MDEPAGTLRIQVCYAAPQRLILRELTVAAGTSVEQAIRQSGILEEAPETDLVRMRIGIYGKLKTGDTVVRDHDRVEIYRPLLADPKEARRKRAGPRRNPPPSRTDAD